MGDAQSVPVLGEAVTVIDSGVKTIAAGACAVVGEDEAAEKLIKGAGNSWKEYSEKNLVAGFVNATVHKINGDEEECERISKKALKSLEGFVDSVPVVGHVKGVGHYIANDTEHGNRCMLGATRGAAVLGAGVLTGGLGGGVVLGGLAGVGTGMTYDGTVSVIDSAVHNENRPHGLCAVIDDFEREGDPNKVVDFSLGLVGDFATGAGGAKAGEQLAKAVKIRNQRKAVTNSIKNAQKKVPKGSRVNPEIAAKDTMKAAENLNECIKNEGLKGDGHVASVVRDLETNEAYDGFSSRVRENKRVTDFSNENRGNYNSKTHARKYGKGVQSELQKRNPDVKPAQKPSGEPVLNRRQQACAEHDAFNKFYNRASAKAHNAVVCSVQYIKGVFKAVIRCENCKCFAKAMGNVATDLINGQIIPVEQIQPYIVKGCGCGALAVALRNNRSHRH